jgi:hypothetical protein
MNCKILEEMEKDIDHFHINKILAGKGLEDDPEWVQKFEQIIDKYEHVDDLAKEDFDDY